MTHRLPFKDLDEFIAHAEQRARENLTEFNALGPAYLILAADGSLIVMPTEMSNDRQKDASVKIARFFCIAHAAKAVIFVAEAWTSESADLSTPPSQATDRKEIVMVCAEGFGRSEVKTLPIIRNDLKKFSTFGEPTVLKNAKGRFVQILPDQPISPERQAAAQRLLAGERIDLNAVTD